MVKTNNDGATLGFEETLWQAADKMRGHMNTKIVPIEVRLDDYT